MKVYIDKNNRIQAFEIIFEKDKNIYKEDHIKNENYKGVIISEKDYFTIRDGLNNNLKINDFVFDGKKVIVDKINKDDNCQNCPSYFNNNYTVIVDLNRFEVNSDLRRHLKDETNYYLFLENNYDFGSLDISKLDFKDKLSMEMLKKEKIFNYNFFVLLDKNKNLSGYSLVLLEEIPKILVFHSDIKNGGYIIIYKIINYYKGKFNYLDLGGLTKEESGINQFKRKWGIVVKLSDLFLFKDNK